MADAIRLPIQQLDHGKDLPLPQYATEGRRDGYLCGINRAVDDQTQQRVAVSTGVVMAIPQGYEIQVRPRSGLALKQGLTVANAENDR